MSDFASLLAALDRDALTRGTQFERICKWLLASAPEYRLLLEEVWLWKDWPGRKGSRETGIDLVARARDGGLWAIQAKAYHPDYYVTKQDLDSFLSASSRQQFSFRLLIATTDHLGANAHDVLSVQEKPVHVRGRAWLESLELDWPAHPDDLRPRPPVPKEPRPHQREAIAAALQGLAERERGQVIMACGTGKTLVGLGLAEALRSERTLVLVPSLSLLSQTLAEWCANALDDFELLAVCSDQTVAEDEYDAAISRTLELGIPVTTSPIDIRRFLSAPGRRVVFSTYQSSPEIGKAMRSQGDAEVPPFDLAIADEAHRCAGRPSRDFATILDAQKIRVRKRLFMTATPKVFLGKAKGEGEAGEFEVASMDDEATFGPVVHRLSFGEAIARGLLSDYQVAIVVIDDAELRAEVERGRFIEVEGTTVADARTLAQELAVAKLMRDPTYQLRRLVTFHSRVKSALDFAVSLPQTLAMLSDDERPQGVLWAQHVSGEMPTSDRAVILQRLRRLGPGERGVVSNARCLTEGVDVPSLDGVAFLDPLRSKIDILQAVGRAIRRAKDKTVGTVLLPVYVPSTADVATALASSAFAPVWDVLQALRAHDNVLSRELDQLRQKMGEVDGAFEWDLGDLPEAERVDGAVIDRGRLVGLRKLRFAAKLRVLLPSRLDLSAFAQALRVRLVERSTASFEYGVGELRAYVLREGKGRVPQRYVTPGGFGLGHWVNGRRSEYRRGRLSADRATALESVPGWTWDQLGAEFQAGLEHLRALVASQGHARVTNTYRTPSGFRLGTWAQSRRNEYQSGSLSPGRRAALAAFPGWTWDPTEDDLVQGLGELREFVSREGHGRVPAKFRTASGFRLGGWIHNRRVMHQDGKLSRRQITALEAVAGWTWDPIEEDFSRALGALRTFVEREGHARVPMAHTTDTGFRLGGWVNACRTKHSREQLAPERVATLNAVEGWTWDAVEEEFQEGLSELRAFVAREGDARVPGSHVAASGFHLGMWVSSRRSEFRRRTLKPGRLVALEALPGWTWEAREDNFARGLEELRAFAAREGHARAPQSYVSASGFPLGSWLAMMRGFGKVGKLSAQRLRAFEALPGWTLTTREDGFTRGLDELRMFVAREGHANPAQTFSSASGFRLGSWVNSRRIEQRRGSLRAERLAALEELPGWTWGGTAVSKDSC